MDFTAEELDALLAGLFELRLSRPNDTKTASLIESLVWRLGGDPDAPSFGAEIG